MILNVWQIQFRLPSTKANGGYNMFPSNKKNHDLAAVVKENSEPEQYRKTRCPILKIIESKMSYIE
jgi:hypothetical protein